MTDERIQVAEPDREALRRAIDEKRVFLSGPMTGYDDFNEREFVRAQICMKKLGVEFVYNPIMQWIYEPQRISERRDHESYMLECLHELTRTDDYDRPYYHAVVQLDGWEGSEGAVAEDFVARACGIPRIAFADIRALGDDGGGDGDDGTDASDDAGESADPGDGDEASEGRLEGGGTPIPTGIWDEWDGIQLRWESVGQDGSTEGRYVDSLDDLRPVEAVTLLAIQGIVSGPGHEVDKGDVRQARVIETPTTGMNAFENKVRCDFATESGDVGHFSFTIAGPAIPDSGAPLSEQIWTSDVVWE